MPTLSVLDCKSLLIREDACLNVSVAALVSDQSYQKLSLCIQKAMSFHQLSRPERIQQIACSPKASLTIG